MTSPLKLPFDWFLLAISILVQPIMPAGRDQDRFKLPGEAVRRQDGHHPPADEAGTSHRRPERNQLVERQTLPGSCGQISLAQVGNPAWTWRKTGMAGLDAVRENWPGKRWQTGTWRKRCPNPGALKMTRTTKPCATSRPRLIIGPRTCRHRAQSGFGQNHSEIRKEKVEVATQVQNASLLYEMANTTGRSHPRSGSQGGSGQQDRSILFDLVKEARFAANAAPVRLAKTSIATVEKAWIRPPNETACRFPTR